MLATEPRGLKLPADVLAPTIRSRADSGQGSREKWLGPHERRTFQQLAPEGEAQHRPRKAESQYGKGS